jgi:hypothetical protein
MPILAPLHEPSVTAPVSHQKRLNQSATNAIEIKRKLSKTNEPDRYTAALNSLVGGSSLIARSAAKSYSTICLLSSFQALLVIGIMHLHQPRRSSRQLFRSSFFRLSRCRVLL